MSDVIDLEACTVYCILFWCGVVGLVFLNLRLT